MNGNNNGNMNTFELPPIRKIGPAVLPKPKNIKIQAGRVIRLNYSNNFTQQTWNQLNQQDENEDEFIDHFSSISDNTAHRPIQEEVTNNDVDDDDDLPLPPPPSQQLLNEINNRLAKFENMPSRAKLVKIPVDDEVVDYETAATASDMRYDKENDMSTSSTILSNDNSQSLTSSSDLMNNGLILSTSRYKFPRKNSGLNTAQNQQKLQQSQMIAQSPPPPPTPPLPPPPPLPPVYPSSISPAKTCTINGMKPTTINFSADAGTNGRPTITITTSRGPNSPTITATTSPTSSQSNIFSYNIPVQHMYQQQQQQQLGNSTNSTNEMGPPGSPTVSNNTITLPLTANGGGNFIISASSLSGLPQEFLLNGNMITKPTLISNGSYIIPVSMKLMSGGGNSNGAPSSPPPTLVGASSSSSSSLSSPPTINTTSINSPTHHRNNSSPSSSSSPHSPLSGHNSPSSSSTSTQHQYTASAGNNNGNISPTSPSSPLGNILIKTTNGGGPGVSGRTRIEDEVDLLKDLLIKNLNSAVIKETQSQNQNKFYGVCNRCNEKIIGAENGLRAMENLFHVTCFVCYGCGTQLQGHHFYAMENRSFCENCYMRLLERCSYCSKPITDRILRATGKPFHPECFCCVACKKNLDGIPFTVDASNKIHCIECFHEKYAPRCFICHLPITPDPGQEETVRIVAMDRSFHVNCYKCEECGVSLSSNSENAGGCFPLDDHIYCKSCNLKLIRSLAMNGGMTHPSSPISKFTPASSQAPRSTDL